MRPFVVFALLALASCSAENPEALPLQAPELNPPAGGPSKDPEACATNVVPLTLTYVDGVAHDQLVAVHVGDEDGWLAIDMGSALTFLYGPDSLAKKPIAIGCETIDVITRDFDREQFGGKPIVGVMGADFLITKLTDFDYPGKRIVRHTKDAPAATDGYLVVPWEDADGHVALRASIDGASRVLMFDTGAVHSLLLGVEGRQGDEESAISDAGGNVLPAWIGDSDVALGAEVKRVPVFRVPRWPYFESYARDLHPEMAGIFGLTSMGFRRIVIDPRSHVLRLGPIREVP